MGVVSRRRVWLVGVGGIYGCGCKEVYIDFLILLIPTPLVFVLFYSSIPTFCSFLKMFFVIIMMFSHCCNRLCLEKNLFYVMSAFLCNVKLPAITNGQCVMMNLCHSFILYLSLSVCIPIPELFLVNEL